jgi:hypothetical protein
VAAANRLCKTEQPFFVGNSQQGFERGIFAKGFSAK